MADGATLQMAYYGHGAPRCAAGSEEREPGRSGLSCYSSISVMATVPTLGTMFPPSSSSPLTSRMRAVRHVRGHTCTSSTLQVRPDVHRAVHGHICTSHSISQFLRTFLWTAAHQQCERATMKSNMSRRQHKFDCVLRSVSLHQFVIDASPVV